MPSHFLVFIATFVFSVQAHGSWNTSINECTFGDGQQFAILKTDTGESRSDDILSDKLQFKNGTKTLEFLFDRKINGGLAENLVEVLNVGYTGGGDFKSGSNLNLRPEAKKPRQLFTRDRSHQLSLQVIDGKNLEYHSDHDVCSLSEYEKNRYVYQVTVKDLVHNQELLKKTIIVTCEYGGFNAHMSPACDNEGEIVPPARTGASPALVK